MRDHALTAQCQEALPPTQTLHLLVLLWTSRGTHITGSGHICLSWALNRRDYASWRLNVCLPTPSGLKAHLLYEVIDKWTQIPLKAKTILHLNIKPIAYPGRRWIKVCEIDMKSCLCLTEGIFKGALSPLWVTQLNAFWMKRRCLCLLRDT